MTSGLRWCHTHDVPLIFERQAWGCMVCRFDERAEERKGSSVTQDERMTLKVNPDLAIRNVPATSLMLYEQEVKTLNERIEVLLSAIHEPTRFLLERGWKRDDFGYDIWFPPHALMFVGGYDLGHAVRIEVHRSVEHGSTGDSKAQILSRSEAINRELLEVATAAYGAMVTGVRWCNYCGHPDAAGAIPMIHTSTCFVPKLQAAIAKVTGQQ